MLRQTVTLATAIFFLSDQNYVWYWFLKNTTKNGSFWENALWRQCITAIVLKWSKNSWNWFWNEDLIFELNQERWNSKMIQKDVFTLIHISHGWNTVHVPGHLYQLHNVYLIFTLNTFRTDHFLAWGNFSVLTSLKITENAIKIEQKDAHFLHKQLWRK